MTRRVLVIDDDAEYRIELRALLGKDWEILEAPDRTTGRRMLLDGHVDVVLLDFHLPEGSGIDLLVDEGVRAEDVPIVMLSVNENPRDVARAIQAGADSYLGKRSNHHEIALVLEQACRRGRERKVHRLDRQRRGVVGGALDPRSLVGDSAAMRRLREEIARVGPAHASVLVTGESGSGKELVARALHAASGAPPDLLVDLFVPAVTRELFQDELFGHKGGAYTGGSEPRVGCIEAAHGGTLLLDEVAEVDVKLQPSLLRVLQSGEYRRIGEDPKVRRYSDFRVIAMTQEDLEARVREGRFRRDLLHRIAMEEVRVPPLRERLDDVPEIARHLLRRNSWRTGRERETTLTDEAAARLMAREYRDNNVRELESVLLRLAIRAEGGVIDHRLVDTYFARQPRPDDAEPGTWADLFALPYRAATAEARARFARAYVRRALKATGGNVPAAARLSGTSRTAFWRTMRALGLLDEPGTDAPA